MLTPQRARAIAVAWQGFAARRRRATVAEVESVIQRLGAVQLDSVTAVDRAHRLTLASRVGKLPDEALNTLRRRGRVFEYWAHEACLLPISDYPYLRRRMIDGRHHPWFGESVLRDHGDLARQVLADIEREGPRSPRAYGGAGGGYWEWTPVKKVFETLWTTGDLAVRERRGFERIYDLTERLIPTGYLGEPPSVEECLRHFVLRTVRARGLATVGRLADYYRVEGGRKTLDAAVAEVIATGAVVPVLVGDREALADPEALAAPPPPMSLAVLLCPFDNLIWDREETRRLFGFSHALEIYKREPDRIWGYYVLPLLVGDRLVGRVDLRSDRKAGLLRILAVHWEGRPSPRALDRALERLATSLGLQPGPLPG